MRDLITKAINKYFDMGYVVLPATVKYINGKKNFSTSIKWRSDDITREYALSKVTNDNNFIAMLTGKKYDLFVVDVDTKEDPEDIFVKTFERYGIFWGNGPQVQSWSGGRHYYYKFPKNLKGKSTREGIIKNLDIRGDGGLIFVPPSRLNGYEYKWLVKLSNGLSYPPENLIKLINDNTIEYKERPKQDKFKNVPDACLFLKYTKLGYDDWLKCGMALSNMGEDGRKYFHLISDNEFYNDDSESIDTKFDNFLQTTSITEIESLFWVANSKGFKLEKNTFDNELDYETNVIFSRDELGEALYKQAFHGNDEKFSLGWVAMNDYIKLLKPQLTIITGMPYSGKSNFLDAVMVNMAKRYDWRFLIFSPESQPLNEHIESLSNKFSGMPLRPGYSTQLPKEDHNAVIDWIAKHFFIMNTLVVNRKLDHILKIVEANKIENDIDAFVLDPWNELEHARPAYQSETEYIGYILGRIKAIALQLDIHVFIVAHPSKVFPEKEGQKRVVKPYDISGSANWFNKADNVLSVYRDFKTDEVEIYIQKVKRRRMGKLGCVPMQYIFATGDYSDSPTKSDYAEMQPYAVPVERMDDDDLPF